MPPQVEELLAKCELAMKSRNFEEAVTGCRAVLNIAPDNVRAKEMLDDAQSKLEAELFVRENLRKAQDAFQNRDFQRCVNECQKIQLLDPDNPSVRDLMTKAQQKLEAEPFIQNFVSSGQSLFDSGLYGEAIAQWEKVRAIDPVFPDLDAMIQGAREKLGGEAPILAGAPSLDLGAGEAELDLGAADFGGGGPESEGEIQRLLAEGDRFAQSGEYQRAIEVWSEIFMLDVVNVDALQRIEAARNQMSQAPQPAAQAEEGEAEPEAGGLDELIARGSAAEAAGQYREAAQFFSQALAIDAENAELADKIKNLNILARKQDRGKTVLGNARAFIEEGKLDSARHALSKILEADPENEEALEMMRELKGKIGSAPSMEARATAPAARRAVSAPFPVIPAAVIAVLVVALGAGAYYMFFKGPSAETAPPHVAKVAKQTSASKPKSASQQPAPVVVTPEAMAAAQKAAQEADFYYQEKHDPEAIQKATEALNLDPGNKLAQDTKAAAERRIQEALAAEKKLLEDANNYFAYSDFAGAVKLYEKYVERHPESVNDIQPQIVKCYYNLGVITIRQWKCDTAADYFRQVLFIDENDGLSKDALALARKCQQVGSSDLEMRKQVAFLEMRK